jgi:hypothetical protein
VQTQERYTAEVLLINAEPTAAQLAQPAAYCGIARYNTLESSTTAAAELQQSGSGKMSKELEGTTHP